MKTFKFILWLLFVLTTFNLTSAYSQNNNNIIVLVKYKTQPGKESLAISAIKTLIDKVKKEPHFIDIVIHIDPIDKSNILLYEKWSNEDYYKDAHMKTVHLQQFINDSRTFLAGPPDISFWKLEK